MPLGDMSVLGRTCEERRVMWPRGTPMAEARQLSRAVAIIVTLTAKHPPRPFQLSRRSCSHCPHMSPASHFFSGAVLAALVASSFPVHAFYLPGAAPHDYESGENVHLFVNALTPMLPGSDDAKLVSNQYSGSRAAFA